MVRVARSRLAASESPCAPKKHCFSFHLPKIHCNLPKLQHTCSYEWVPLKKKHCFLARARPQGNLQNRLLSMRRARVVFAPSGPGQLAYPAPRQAYGGFGQHAFLPARPATCIASVTEMTPAVAGGEEAPPAPEVRETSAIGAPTGGLLLPTPSRGTEQSTAVLSAS